MRALESASPASCKTPAIFTDSIKIKEAIFKIENQKSPGIDGIPIKFYKEYYKLLEDLYQSYTNILFQEQESTKTMKQAIITL